MAPTYTDPITSVHEEEIDDEGYFQTPVVSTDGGSAPPSPPRVTSRPRLGSHLVLNLVNWHPLPSLWTTHRDGGMSSDEEIPATSLRYPVALRTALIDITNINWSDTEDDNDSDYDGDDEIEERRSRDDDVMVYMVESTDEDTSSPPVSPLITPLPQVEGDPTSFEEGIITIESPDQELRTEGDNHSVSPDTMEVEVDTSEDDTEYEQQVDESTSSGSSHVATQGQPAEYPPRASPIRYFRRLSLYDIGNESPRHQLMPFHRRHSMGEVAMVAV